MWKGVEVVGDETVYCCVVRSWLLDRDGLGEMAQSESHQAQDGTADESMFALSGMHASVDQALCPMRLSSQGLAFFCRSLASKTTGKARTLLCIAGGCDHSIGFILRISFASSSPETPADPYHESDSCATLSHNTDLHSRNNVILWHPAMYSEYESISCSLPSSDAKKCVSILAIS